MNFLEMFNNLESVQPVEETYDPATYQPTYTEQPPMSNWQDDFYGIKSRPVLYNVDGYVSPYASGNWGGTSSILRDLDDVSKLPPLSEKIDPNKIFTSDISALRTLAADQLKTTKLFEKKLTECLASRGKSELNEMDIMAMQALTASRNSITAINKEQIAIKKNIAELRIKQASNGGVGGATAPGAVGNGRGPSSIEIGRSIMDSIFDAPISSIPTPTMGDYQPVSYENASRMLDELVEGTSPNAYIQYENCGPTTYVVVGANDDDVEFVTKDRSGETLHDYPNPINKITEIDREAGTATDELLVQYPVIFRN